MAPEDMTHAPPRIDFEVAGGKSGTRNTEPSTTNENGTPSSIAFGVLNRKHPEYDADYWKTCRALYSGGRKMLRDVNLLRVIFPQHRNESEDVWMERVKRAFYVSYPGEILDYMLSGLMASPIVMSQDEEDEQATGDPYYADFFADVSPAGGKQMSFQRLMREQILSALLFRRAWTQVDFPAVGDLDPTDLTSEAEQTELGLLDAYALPVDPEAVYDWEEDGTGELTWALVCVETAARASVLASRDVVTRTYTIYDRERWCRYAITYNKKTPPKEDQAVPLVAEGAHSFERVPLLRLELPEGLWMMNKLASLAIEFFNKRCALAWAEYKSLFQERYEFETQQDPMSMGAGLAADPNRALNQVHGLGYTQVRDARDRVEFVGPSSEPFKVALESLKDLRDEMHRITYQTALSFDNSAAALGRSGDSKAQDKASHAVMLMGLGEYVREHAEEVMRTISVGRQEPDVEWSAIGMNRFDTTSSMDMILGAEKLELISIPSPTFQRRYKFAIAKQTLADLGDEATEEDLEKIEEELEENLTPEVLGAGPLGGTPPPVVELDAEGNPIEAEEDEEGEAPPPPPANGGRPTGYSSPPAVRR